MGMFNNLNSSEEFGFLDMITIAGFLAQIDNMNKDEVQTNYTRVVIKAIVNEIEKLHKENDIIMAQNEEILELLRRKNV